ncbi:hypothetical protein CS063_15630 [Sporanaerobium hydrogeniformans]|uniref:Uncharacterized protein n=1 Tax=Sporanaerobium hydrogeniformans TaxID=3072179 RepID=A0AC61D9X1_9FIRM|nr:hypothetical protein [Sporanaerobium hydrogeniformans]PHV69493.1 hypothetical protein CS063_15630 [Sporanaerobium hydrogeniformans]
MQKIKQYIVIDCYAFTVIVLVNALLQKCGIAKEQSLVSSLYIFLTSTLVAVFMCITDQLMGKQKHLKRIFRIVDVLVPTFFMSMLQSKFHLSLKDLVMTVIFSLIAYGIVSLMMYLSWRERDIKLNENIQRMRRKK